MKGPQRRPQKRFDRRLEEVAKAVVGYYCRFQMPLKLAVAVRETVSGHRLGALERVGGYVPPLQCIPATGVQNPAQEEGMASCKDGCIVICCLTVPDHTLMRACMVCFNRCTVSPVGECSCFANMSLHFCTFLHLSAPNTPWIDLAVDFKAGVGAQICA